jgi:hypothetical protein
MAIRSENLKPLHNRMLEISTYVYDTDTILVKGQLVDDRKTQAYSPDGTRHPPGVIHSMSIRMLVEMPGMAITDVESEMMAVPHTDCRDVEESLTPLKGMQINAGFTERVKRTLGGKNSCAHMVALMLAMAPAAVQAAFAARAEKPLNPNTFSQSTLKILADTCWVWRSGGPMLEELTSLASPQAEENSRANAFF